MFEVTQSATQQIAEYFKGKEVKPIRVFLNQGGCGGPSLAMALDEPKDTDSFFDVDGFTYVIDKEFLEKVQPVKVDFINYGFKITAGVEFGGGGCSGCKSSGSCR